MRIVITGASGLIGSALSAALIDEGHEVRQLVRSRPTDPNQFRWDPADGTIDEAAFGGADAVVHLAGENIAGRWTPAKKRRIRDSRVQGTRLVAQTLARLEEPPRVLACASAIGYYGDRGDEQLTEQSSPGEGFIIDVVRDWEAATAPAAEAGVRVVNMRTGIAQSAEGGALKTTLAPFKLGLGGRLGSGRQYVSWVALADVVGAYRHVLAGEALFGPVNVTAPNPVTNTEYTKTLARVLGRPAILPVPRLALRLALGELADEALASTRVRPVRLLESGYEFAFPQLEGALRHLLGG